MVAARRVVVTGIGITSSIGLGAAPFWDSLSHGRSGIKPITAFDASGLTTRIGGQITGFDAKNYIDKANRKSLRVMARAIQLAVAAAQLALDDSKIDKNNLDPTRFGVEFGAGLMPTELDELAAASRASTNGQAGAVDLKLWGEHGLAAIPPLWMLKYLPNMHACHVSILHNAQGPNNSITESDVAGLLALGEASRILRRGQADFFLVGGADSKINPLSMVRQCLFGHLSRRNEPSAQACRPFERGRDGTILGEGSAVLAVEDLAHAQKRRAAIYGEIIGFGAAFDRGCTGKGLARAIHAALAQANVRPDDIGHINAHGLSSIHADAWEARGIREAFGDRKTPVWAAKSYFGNMGSGGPLVECAGSLLAVKHGLLPATLNYEEPDPVCPINVNRTNQPLANPLFLKIAFTEMGQCAAVVCRKWE
ncbi:MAG TPA: beta-ketoacyl-[acyl-carrier-protein] synthase family protein [Gemmataceae bacterium]|nr:beta-ketoacyl-[acyl-carrier-protein] synthase family protein [Gemmataceae bacterium]